MLQYVGQGSEFIRSLSPAARGLFFFLKVGEPDTRQTLLLHQSLALTLPVRIIAAVLRIQFHAEWLAVM